MPTTTPEFALVIPGSGSEPPNGYKAIKELGESAEAALVKVDTVPTSLWARSAVQGIPNTTDTLVLWNTTDNHGDGYNVYWTQAAGIVTILEDGVYDVSAFVEWASNATGYRGVYLYITPNGGALTFYDGVLQNAVNGAVTRQKYPPETLVLSEGDTLELHVVQNSGGALNIAAATKMRIRRRGR